MKELEETNCEIRNIINFTLPLWDQSSNFGYQEEPATTDGSKESNETQTAGGFFNNDCKYAWLCHGTRLVVVDVRYGKCISSWHFANKITTVSAFPAEPGQVPLLLVGLDNNAIRIKDSIGHLCIFDCCTSTILTTIQVPAGVEKACIIHGGAEWEEFNEKRPDTVLSGNTGLIFAALRNLQHVVIDINRPAWTNSFLDGKSITAKLEFINPTSAPTTPNSKSKKEPTHLAYDLMDREIEQYMGFDREDFETTPLYDESLSSVLLSSTKTGCLITGCLGRVIIWQNDGSIGWISPPFDENAYVTHIALLEPSDDPRPFYYLWIACQNDSPESSAVLRMYAMFFNRKQPDSSKSGEGASLYFSLESEPSLKFELELEQGERVHSLLPVERENPRDSADMSSRRGEDSLLLIGSDERVLLFDLNRWYKEQMPRTMAECRNPNSVMASYRTKQEELDAKKNIVACSYIPRSLREFPGKGPSSPEELFYPNALTLEWVELGLDNLTFWLARGVQSELLREVTIAGPIVLVKPTETYRRCLAAGLVPFDSLPQDYAPDAYKTQQREMLLSLCLEQRWTVFLARCANEWSDGSAAYLYPEFLRWGVQRASELKLCADRLCVPLFDQSGANIGETEVRTLRFCGQQLECLTSVVSKLPNLEADLEKQRRALKRIATYLQVLLWFYDVGLLPESQEMVEEELEEDMPQITLSMKIPYPRDKLIELYKKKRRSMRNGEGKEEENLFIDQLVFHECSPLRKQWEREAGYEIPDHGGYYPPPSLQSLLRSYLTDCHRDDPDVSTAAAVSTTDEHIIVDEDVEQRDQAEMESKHSITIYLLMDVAMLLQGSHPSVDRLIKYPSAFKLSPSLIKLTQAFWLLDHEDYDGFFKIMTGQLIMSNDVKNWHHRLAVASLLKNDQHKLALTYLRVLKPPLSSLDDQGTIISLSVEQGLVESAFHARPPSHYAQLLTRFFQACKAHGKLADILQLSLDTEEEEAFVRFLKEGGSEDTRLLYYLQRCRHAEASDVFNFENRLNSRRSAAPKKIHPVALQVLNAFTATLPDVTRRFATSLSKATPSSLPPSTKPLQLHPQPHQLSFMDPNSVLQTSGGSRGYPRPMSQCRDKVREIYQVAMSKTRETCLKSNADRASAAVGGSASHVPFLNAPCSTIVYCTRGTGNLTEPTDAYTVLYPERKVAKGKRTHGMMDEEVEEEEEDNVEVNLEKKRRRLGSGMDMDLSSGDNDGRMTRRLSMSQVCETPLVQRKMRPDGRETNGLAVDTPHSILKIRQMLRRNSNSPGYGFLNLSSQGYTSAEREAILKRVASGDGRSARQIRFSMDRLSGNDTTRSTANESNREEQDQQSYHSSDSKDAEEESCVEEAFYSPDVSAKSHRDSSILTDSSITKYIRGPRPRPGLRRSSVLSRASSDYLSHKTSSSANTTLNVSALDTSSERSKKPMNASSLSPRKTTAHSPTLYNSSILSVNTSVESSPFKRPFTLNNNERNDDNDDDVETEESEEQSEDEEVVVVQLSDTGVDKDSSLESSPSVKEPEEKEEEQEEEEDEEENEKEEDKQAEAQSEEQRDEELETQDEDEDEDEDEDKEEEQEHERSTSVRCNLPQENEISEDEDEAEEEPRPSLQTAPTEEEDEEEEDPDHEDTFQSLSNSLDNALTSEVTANCIRELEENINRESRTRETSYSFTRTTTTEQRSSVHRYNHDQQDRSLTSKLVFERQSDSVSSGNYSLTKPIFLDSRGIVKFEDSIVAGDGDITDDESLDGEEIEIERPQLEETREDEEEENEEEEDEDEDEDEAELTLNLSASDGSDGEKKKREVLRENGEREKEEEARREENTVEKETRSFVSELVDSSAGSGLTRRERTTPRKETSLSQGSLSRLSSMKSDDLPAELDTSPRRGNRQHTSVTLKEPTPRRSIKTASASPPSKIPTPRRSIKTMSLSPGAKVNESVQSRTSGRKVSTEREKRSTSVTKEEAIDSRASGRKASTDREQRSTSVTKEVKMILARAIHVPTIQVDSPSPPKPKHTSIPKSPGRKSRAPSQDKARTPSPEEPDEPSPSFSPISDKSTSRRVGSRASLKEPKEQTILEEPAIVAEAKQTKPRATRAASVGKEERKPRKTRAASVAKESAIPETAEEREEEKKEEEEMVDEPKVEKRTGKGRATRASSMAKETTATGTAVKRTAHAEKLEELDETQDTEKAPKSRATRASSQAKDASLAKAAIGKRTRACSVSVEDLSVQEIKPARKARAGSVAAVEDAAQEEKLGRKTRAGSVAVDEESHKEEPTRRTRTTSVSVEDEPRVEDKPTRKTRTTSVSLEEEPSRVTRAGSVAKEEERKTRASSLARETSNASEEPQVPKRSTRASSLAKDASGAETANETLSRRPTRKRGNSVPKEVPPVLESSRLNSRHRRSASLLKEVILEESISQLDSPVSVKRTKTFPLDSATSSPAANTRSRRSSIQSVPEELEEVLSVPTASRATSKRTIPTSSGSEAKDESRGRRATSVDSTVLGPAGKRLTRSVLAKTAIIEEVIPEETVPQTRRQTTARRKRATSLSVEAVEEAEREKEKGKTGRPKRGRKASESKDFQFSAPEEAGELPDSNDEDCRTPTFKFSEPTGLQKFITPVRYANDDDDEESPDLTTNAEQATSARPQRRPRTCFVLLKKTKDKAN